MRPILIILIWIIASCNSKVDTFKGETVILRNNNLSEIPDSIFQKPDLACLNIGCEGFTMYPPLSALGEDGISYVEIPLKKLPEKIGDLTNLRTLILNGTKIERLPLAITKLSKLDTLDLSLNKNLDILAELNKIKILANLKVLNIYHTKLDTSKINLIKKQLNKRTKVIFSYSQFANENNRLPTKLFRKAS